MIYDVAIVGMGMGGSFAAHRLATEQTSLKVLGIDIGRSPQKRRSQMIGFLGLLPFSDGKLYTTDIQKVAKLTGIKKAKSNYNLAIKTLQGICATKETEDKSLYVPMVKKLAKNGYEYELNNHIQMIPKEIHALSKVFSNSFETNSNLDFLYDNEVNEVRKEKGVFVLDTDDGEFRCKKLIIGVGRSGWRWSAELFKKFGIIENNNVAKFGVRGEINAGLFKEFNKANCTLSKDGVEIGPLSWHGTVIPEDHVDMALASFRSNENRWKTDKVSFDFFKSVHMEDRGFEEADRLAKLTFVLTNDRILKEKAIHVVNGKSTLSIIKEYNWLKEAILDFNNLIPEFSEKAYIHMPNIYPFAPQIKIGSNLETEIENMYVIGEAAGTHGLMSAAIMGTMIASEMMS